MIRRSNSIILRYLLVPAVLAALGASCSDTIGGRDISGSGTIEATDVNVASKVIGQILDLRVDEGSTVTEGAVLAIVDHATLNLQHQQAVAGVQLAEANLKLAGQDLARILKLSATGTATQKQKDDAEIHKTVAEAQLAQARAQAAILEKTISDCTITAPVSGVVTNKPVEAGEYVMPGTTIVTISHLSEVNLVIYVPEAEIGRIKLGQAAEVRIDSFPRRAFTGTVVYISPEAEFTPKNIQTKDERVKLVFGVKIEIPNADGSLKPGLPADGTILANGSPPGQPRKEPLSAGTNH